ncbi:MAG: hypothetical protein ACKPJJ_32210, partial [Planctomycetaceae bacterium]
RTLKAAVADASSGDVILLQYNGYPDDLPAQPPVRIVDMNLIVRAADGYRPTLEFDGVAESSLQPFGYIHARAQEDIVASARIEQSLSLALIWGGAEALGRPQPVRASTDPRGRRAH